MRMGFINSPEVKKNATLRQALRWENLGKGGVMLESDSVAVAAQQGEKAEAAEQGGGWFGDGCDHDVVDEH